MADNIERNLSVLLRPRRFSEVVGYASTIAQIKTQFESGRIPLAMMFVGVSRGGKTTLAKIVATSVNCTHAPFGEPCDDCIEKVENHGYDVQEINAANLNKVEDARTLVKELKYTPPGLFRVFILNECQQMTDAAQNVILDPTENDNGCNMFIFTTTDPAKMIIPLKKRCGSNLFHLDGLDQQDIKRLVFNTSQQIPVEGGWDNAYLGELTRLLWERQIVAPGDVVSAVEAASNGATAENAAVCAEFSGKVDVYALGNSVIGGVWGKCQEMLAKAEPRDADGIRLYLAAVLRKRLLNSSGVAAEKYVQAIEILGATDTPITGMQLNLTAAAIFRLCGLFGQRAGNLQKVA